MFFAAITLHDKLFESAEQNTEYANNIYFSYGW